MRVCCQSGAFGGCTSILARSGSNKAFLPSHGAGEYLCFLHADSQPPQSLVHVVRATLAAPRTVAGGFRTLITRSSMADSQSGSRSGSGAGGGGGGNRQPRLLRFMTAHHLLKTYYMPMIARPLMFWRCGIAWAVPGTCATIRPVGVCYSALHTVSASPRSCRKMLSAHTATFSCHILHCNHVSVRAGEITV